MMIELGMKDAYWVAGLMAMAAGLGFSFYHFRRRAPMKSGTGYALLAMRLTALALIAAALGGLRQARRPPEKIGKTIHCLIDRSRSMADNERSLKSVLEQLGRWAREQNVQLAAHAFSSDLAAAKSPAAALEFPAGPETRLSSAVEKLGAELASASVVIVLSDGVATESSPPPSTRLKIYPIAFGGEPESDLELADLRFPSAIFARGEAPFRLKVIYPAGLRDTVRLNLKDLDTGETLWRASMTLSGFPPQDMELTLPVPRQVGEKNWELRALPGPWDANAANNAIVLRTEVLREKLRVLYVCGRPAFDYAYLRELIRSRSSRELVSFVILRNPEDIPPYGEQELSLIPFPHQDIFTQNLSEFDVLILHDFSFARFALPPAYLDNVRAFAAGGGGVIFISGSNALIPQDRQGVFLAETFGLVPDAQEGLSIGPHELSVKDAGLWNRLFGLHHDPARNLDSWTAALRSRYTAYPHGITAASSGPLGQSEGRHPLMIAALKNSETGRSNPAVALRSWGKGRAAWVGFAGSWLWKANYGAQGRGVDLYDAFWEGLLGWVSRENALNEGLRVYIERGPDGRAKVTARLDGGPKGQLTLESWPQKQKIALTERAEGSGIYEGSADLSLGDEALRFRARSGAQTLEAKALLRLDESLAEERRSQDLAHLEALARGNAGILLGQSSEWLGGMPEAYAAHLLEALKRSEEVPLAASSRLDRLLPVFCLLLASALLLAEWIWRRWGALTG
ncbi:MAG: hypothetical protein HYT79_00070 [Elusimicrobia bacterium]|nr:hypothetical protein [Elusimicrobiota bacterium]